MTTFILRKRSPDSQQSRDAASWLGLAASPVFALMAWVSNYDVQGILCASGSGILPISGMAWMYLLMSIVHFSPWLKLASALSQQLTQQTPQTRGD
jgi:hypothetical protein